MPHYIDLRDFVAVLTPHFLEQSKSRNMPTKKFNEPLIRAAFRAAKTFCQGRIGFEYFGGYIYCRAEFNVFRLRWELTFISFTPSSVFATQNNNVTKFVRLGA